MFELRVVYCLMKLSICLVCISDLPSFEQMGLAVDIRKVERLEARFFTDKVCLVRKIFQTYFSSATAKVILKRK